MRTHSWLTLILTVIFYWQAKEIEWVLLKCATKKDSIGVGLSEHVRPIERDIVLVTGEYDVVNHPIEAA